MILCYATSKRGGLTCTCDEECCSRKRDIEHSNSLRCRKSTELCNVDLDCERSNRRGYMCPEFLAMPLDGLC
jgi:hypothetical protein